MSANGTRRVVYAAIASFLLAGCLSGPAQQDGDGLVDGSPADTERLHSVAEILPFEAQGDDGVALRGHVYLPDGEGPFATVLEYSPYWNTIASYGESEGQVVEVEGRKTLALWLGRYLDAGFAVALVNWRGTGESGGCMEFLQGTHRSTDAYAVIETLAAQPWSNGNVGMIGMSASAGVQWWALAAKPPSLKAIISVSGGPDLWSAFSRHGALLNNLGPIVSPVFLATSSTGIGAGRIPPEPRAEHLTCPGYADELTINTGYAWNGDRTAEWVASDMRPHIAGTTVPTFYTVGLLNGLEEGGVGIDGLWDLLAGDKYMLVAPWTHGYPDPGYDTTQTGGDYEPFRQMSVAWMDHYLRGGPALVQAGVAQYQDRLGEWHFADSWPPKAENTRLHLSGTGLTLDADKVATSSQTFQSEADDPRPDTCPGHKAIFVSPPLANDVLLAGNFIANLTLTSDLPDSNIAAFLYRATDLHPCGGHTAAWLEYTESQRENPLWPFGGPMSGGVPSVEVSRALGDLRHVNGNDAGKEFPIGTPTAVSMPSHPFAAKVLAGDRLILAIGGGSFELQADAFATRLTVSSGPGLAGEIVLPIVEGVLAFHDEAAASGSVPEWNVAVVAP